MSEPLDSVDAGGGTGDSRAAAPHPMPASLLARLQGREGWGLGLLLLVVALVASGPLWAPLLPWAPGNEPAPAAPQQPRERPSQPSTTPADAALQALDRRVGALEARPAASASDLAEIRQEVGKLAGAATESATRIEAVDKTLRSQPAGDPTDIALVLALLQIRDAIEAGRPFAAPYEALATLAHARPEIAEAAGPLAAPATAGLAGRPVLANRLRELAPAIAAPNLPTANPPTNGPATTDATTPDWADQAWQRLSSLVRVRRIDSAGQGQAAAGPAAEAAGPAASVNGALQALAGGDLEGAVGALERLTGAPAETARPWLRMAKERLAAEAALQRIEALLVARLGTPPDAPADSGLPR